MYVPDTILKLREPRSTGKPGTKDYKPFPYDRVRVVGPSPVAHTATNTNGNWVGAAAQGVIIEPLHSFGANDDRPLGFLQSIYEVESEPTIEVAVTQTIRVIQQGQAGPSPEEVFAEEAAKNPQPAQKVQWRQPLDIVAEEQAAKAEKARREASL